MTFNCCTNTTAGRTIGLCRRLQRLALSSSPARWGGSFRSVRDTLVHIIADEWGWLAYWREPVPSAAFVADLTKRRDELFRPDGFPSVAAVQAKWAGVEKEQAEFVNGVTNESLGKMLPFRAIQASIARKGSIFPKDSFVTPFTNSACSFSTPAHLACTAATLGNPSGRNSSSLRFVKSATNAALGTGSLQYASHPHSSAMMWTSVSRTERKLPPHLAGELLNAKRCSRLQSPIVRPAVVFVQQLNVIFIHVDGRLTRASGGFYPARGVR